MNQNTPVIVYGESSASVYVISQLLKLNEKIVWVSGSQAKLLPVMPFVKSPLALGMIHEAQSMIPEMASLSQDVQKGCFHRVFRNKSFKLPSWKRTANLESQKAAFEEMVWAPEQAFIGVEEYRISNCSLSQVEQSLRDAFELHPNITRVNNAPIIELEIHEHGGKMQFANQFVTEFKQFFFCDELTELRAFPKLATVFKHQLSQVRMGSRMNALQVVFNHSAAFTQSFDTGLVIPMNRDAGETFDRDAMGYFINPTRSVWTVFMKPEECEENHEIMKKLRKMKQSLNRAFESPELLPEGKKDFSATIEKEMVHFEESYIVTEGEIKASPNNADYIALTDSFGYSTMLERVAQHFGISELEAIENSTLDLESIEMPAHLSSDHEDSASV